MGAWKWQSSCCSVVPLLILLARYCWGRKSQKCAGFFLKEELCDIRTPRRLQLLLHAGCGFAGVVSPLADSRVLLPGIWVWVHGRRVHGCSEDSCVSVAQEAPAPSSCLNSQWTNIRAKPSFPLVWRGAPLLPTNSQCLPWPCCPSPVPFPPSPLSLAVPWSLPSLTRVPSVACPVPAVPVPPVTR